MKRIVVRADLCSGCRACEVACVARHERCFGTAAARIRVIKVEPLGQDHPRVCRLCPRPACLEACPNDALSRDAVSGAILLHSGRCTGCAACLEACPFGAAWMHPETGLPLICDLCGGDPACVKRCATGAIIYAGGSGGTEPTMDPPASWGGGGDV